MSKESSRTQIVLTETIYLGREHLQFLDNVIKKLKKTCNYKASRSQIMRLLLEIAMDRDFEYDEIHTENDLRRMIEEAEPAEPTNVRNSAPKKV